MAAISHLTQGLEVLKTLPETPERTQQELDLQTALGLSLTVTKGYAAVEVEHAYARARELCQQAGDTPQLFRVLVGLWRFYLLRGQLQTARELAEQLLTRTQGGHDPLGVTLYYLGELTAARAHLEQAMARYALQMRRSVASRDVQDPGVGCLSYMGWILWLLGYPDQALKMGHEALTLALAAVHKSGERWWEAELYRLKGKLLLWQPVGAGLRPVPTEDAEACFQQALAITRRHQAKSLELRAAMSLSRLSQHQGKRGEARQLLAEVYGWFTEGFETADLQEAKALLEELSSE